MARGFLGGFFLCAALPVGLIYLWGLLLAHRRKAIAPWGWGLAMMLPLVVTGLAVLGASKVDWDEDSALMTAACGGDSKRVERELIEGADPNEKDSYEVTPLQCAVENRHVAVAELLLKHGADPDYRCGDDCEFDGPSPRQVAEEREDSGMRKLFERYPPKQPVE